MSRWSGIGLVICALVAIAVSLWLNLRMRNMTPFDGTYLGIALSLVLWAMAAAQLGLLLWKRAQPRDNSTKRRFRIQPNVTSPLPLGVQVTFATAQTIFLVVIMTLTLVNGALGVAPADQQLIAANVVIAQAFLNLLALMFGQIWLTFRHNGSLTD